MTREFFSNRIHLIQIYVQKKAIIIGASSGIGEALARLLSKKGYHVGLAARRQERLERIARELTHSKIAVLNVDDVEKAQQQLVNFIDEFKQVNLFVICAGVGFENPDLAWEAEFKTISTNVVGFAAMANTICLHLQSQGKGTLAAISSISALRGHRTAPAYGASKAFMSNYLEGLRHSFAKRNLPVSVLDIQPGFVDTAMAKGDNLFWVAPPEKAAKQIYKAILKRKRHVYVTKRWRLFAWIIKIMPAWMYHRV